MAATFKSLSVGRAAKYSQATLLMVNRLFLLKETLTGLKYNNGEIKGALAELAKTQLELVAQINDFEGWLVGEMEG